MTIAEFAMAAFTLCNIARVLAYLPQIWRIAQDRNGACAISYATWGLFTVSHLATVLYALAVLQDQITAVVFGGNLLACLVVLGLTAVRRSQFRRRLHEQIVSSSLTP